MDHPSEKQPYEKPFVGPHAEIRDGHAGKYIAPGTGIPKHVMKNPRILRRRDVAELVGYSSVHLARLEKAGTFPKRVRLGANAVGWVEHEIHEWIAARVSERDQDTGRSGNPADFVMQAMMTTLENFSMMLGPPDPVRSKEGTPVPKWIYAMNNLDERVWCYAPDGIPSEEEIQNTRNPDGVRHIDAPLSPDGPTMNIQRSQSND
jgi:prophage regulatory protein